MTRKLWLADDNGRRSHRLLIDVPPSVSDATSIRRTPMKIACVRPGHPFSVV